MPAARRRRMLGLVAASVAVHALLAVLLVLHAPRLRTPEIELGPPEPIIPILIMPRVPPAPAAAPGSKPPAIRLHRRQTRFSDLPPDVPPLVVAPPAGTQAPAAAATGSKTPPPPAPDAALGGAVRQALRASLNCESPSLTRAERDACWDRFAAGARGAPTLGLGVESGKADDLARAARRKSQAYDDKRATGGVGTTGSGHDAGRIGPPGAPNLGMGASSRSIGDVAGGPRP